MQTYCAKVSVTQEFKFQVLLTKEEFQICSTLQCIHDGSANNMWGVRGP
jgi:hypothetical protein